MSGVTIGAKLEADASGYIKSVGDIRKEVKLAEKDVIAMSEKFGATSKEAAAAAQKAAALKDTIGDAKSLIDAFNPDTKFRAFGASIQTVIGGFTALTGVMGLLGVESEEVQKTLLKVQSALALSQGIAQLQTGMQAFKDLGSVIQNTLGKSGIWGLALAGVAAGVAYLLGVFDSASQKTKTLKESMKEMGKATLDATKEVNLMKAAFRQAESGVITKKEALDKYNNGIGKTIGFAKDLNEAEKLTGENAAAYIEVQGLKAQANFLIAKSAEAAATAMVIQAQIEKEGAKGSIGGKVKDLVNQMKTASTDFDAEIAKIEAKITTASEKFKTITTAPAVQKTDKEKIEEYRSIKHQYTEVDQESTDAEIRQKQFLLEMQQTTDVASTASLNQRVSDHAAGMTQMTSTEEQQTLARIAIAEKEQEAKRLGAQATAQLLDNVSELVGRHTLAGKILAIASATINTYLSVSQALRATPYPPVNFIFAAAALAAGLVTIKKIVSVQVPGKTGGGSAPAAASVAPPLVPRVPEATRTTLNQGQLNQIGNAATRAYVTETDMTNNQEKIRRINRAARIG